MASFIPRKVFPSLDSLPRSYFLGHHRAGLNKMKTMLSTIDLVIECRDYRVPLTSRNPLFEENLAGRQRLIVYTKQDLGHDGKDWDIKVGWLDSLREAIIQRWHQPSTVLFSDYRNPRSVRKILSFARDHAAATDNLMGSRMMIIGMPNVGKSSLLNALRQVGVHKGKAAHTGAQPGVTRKIGTMVKIIEPTEGREAVYLLDTPGVFVPYVPNAESMLKLALCGSVKDTIIAPVSLADYLLFQLNLNQPNLYREYSPPTNDIMSLLEAVARRTGRLQKGGIPDFEASALWLIQRWRTSHLGKFVLDEITDDSLEQSRRDSDSLNGSISQARKSGKVIKRQISSQRNIDIL